MSPEPVAKKRITVGAQSVEATPMPIVNSSEVWAEYLLGDGTVIKVKFAVTEILRLEGQFNDVGDPQFYVRGNQLVNAVNCPEETRKPA